jgi:uncharacterized protein YfdQ (DUF2303 family)
MSYGSSNNSDAASEMKLAVAQGTSDVIQTSLVLTGLAGAALQPERIDGATFLTLPPGYKRENVTEAIEKAQATPARKRGEVQVKDVASLLLALADQVPQGAQGTAYIYADPDTFTITAVFNDNRAATPGWRDYRVRFTAEFTPEFQKWKGNSGQHKSQTEFAEFIEDNMADIPEPGAQILLDVATTIQATTGISFSSAKRLQDGQVQLGYTENIDARAGAGGALTIPKEFDLGLRIFKNGDGYKLKARLKYRLSNPSIKFWYELERPERAIEDAFKGYVDMVRESGYAVLLGKGA